jgi:protein SCO1/2
VFGACVAAAAFAQVAPSATGNDIPNVGVDQRLDTQLPLELVFRDEQGEVVALGEILDGSRPAVLALVYYNCTMLCGEVLNGMLEAFQELELAIGPDYQVITVSFAPAETFEVAAPKQRLFVNAYDRESADAANAWHFLTNDGDSAETLASLVGFRYAYLPDINEYAHGSAIMVLTPGGKVSRYFYGIQYPARDLRLALVEAGEGKIGTLADQFLLMCMHYDPVSGAYTLAVMSILRLTGSATVGLLALFVGMMVLRERRREMAPVVCET